MALDTDGSVSVDITADIDPFVKGLTDAQKAAEAFSVAMSRVINAGVDKGFQEGADKAAKMEAALRSLERRFVAGAAATQDYQKVQNDLNKIVAANPALQERANAVLKGAEDQYGKASLASRLFASATEGVKGQLIALSAGAGPVGVFLSGLGPWGLAAAAGLGLVEQAMARATEQARKIGEWSINIRNVGEASGFTVREVQAIGSAAESVGVSVERAQGWLQRMGLALELARKGGGPLADALARIDTNLLRELQTTKSNAEAWDLLSRALERAGSSSTRLLQSLLGRNAQQAALIFGATRQAGGLSNFAEGQDTLPEQQTKKWAELQSKIDAANSDAERFIAQMYGNKLEGMERMAQLWKETARDVGQANKDASTFTKITADWYLNIANSSPTWLREFMLNVAKFSSQSQLSGQRASPQGRVNDAFEAVPAQSPQKVEEFRKAINGATRDQTELTKAVSDGNKEIVDAQAAYSNYARALGVLGEGATIWDQQRLAIKRVNADLAENVNAAEKELGLTDAQIRARRTSAISLQAESQSLNARVSLLGELATASELTKQKELEYQKAVQQDPTLAQYQDRIRAAQALQVAQSLAGQAQSRAQYGLADSQQLATTRQAELNALISAYNLNAQQAATVSGVLDRKYRDIAESAQVAGSNLPNLTRFALDAGNLDKQLDQFTTGSLNSLTTSLTDITTGTSKAGDAFKNLGATVTRALEEMLIKMAIVQPAALLLKQTLGGLTGGLGSIFGNLFGGGGAAAPTGGAAGTNLSATGGAGHTGNAIIGNPSTYTLSRTLPLSVWANAPRHHTGTPSLGSDEVPFVGKRGEVVGWPDQMRRAFGADQSPQVQVNVINKANNTEVQTQERQEGNLNIKDIIISTINDHAGKGGLDKAMRGRYGLGVQGRAR